MGWQEEIVEKVAKKQDCTYTSVFPGLTRIHLQIPMALVALLNRACEKRDVNVATYIRRSIALIIANDLGMPIHDVLKLSPAIGGYQRKQQWRGQADDGVGIESWCPHPDCDGSHLS